MTAMKSKLALQGRMLRTSFPRKFNVLHVQNRVTGVPFADEDDRRTGLERYGQL